MKEVGEGLTNQGGDPDTQLPAVHAVSGSVELSATHGICDAVGSEGQRQSGIDSDGAHGRFTEWVIRRRGVVLTVALLLMAVAGLAATRVRLNADFVTYLNAKTPLVRAYNYVRDVFGGNETGIVLVTAPDVYQPEVLSLVDELTDAYQAIDGVDYATSLTNTLEFAGTEWGIEVGRLVRRDALPATGAELAELRRRVGANPRISGNLVSADGTLAAIQLRFANGGEDRQATTIATVERVVGATRALIDAGGGPSGVEVHFGGMPFLMYNISLQIAKNMAVLVPLMVAFLVLVLYVGLRHWTGVVYPLAVVLVSSVLVLGIMGVLGLPLDLLSGLVPVVLIVLGSADGIHYMKRYYEHRSGGEPAPRAASGAYREIRVPLVLTTVTTMIGFGSLAISNVAIIRQFGLLTALGLFCALVVTLALLPALAAFGIGAPRSRAERAHTRLIGGLTRVVTHAPRAVLAAGLATALAAGAGMVLIVKSVDWTLCLERSSSPHRAELLLRDKLGGSLPFQLLVRGDLLDPATLLAMRTLERRMDALPTVSKSQSLASLIAEMNAAVNGRYAIPDTREGVANLWFLIEDEDAIEQLVVSGAATEGLVQARVADWETPSIRKAVDGVDGWLGTQTAAMVVVDSRELDDVPDAAVRALRTAELVTQLRWEFAGRGVEAPASLPVLAGAFAEWTPDTVARARVRRAVRRYLESAEAEANIEPPSARQLAELLADAATVWGVDAAGVDAAVRAAVPGIGEWEREALDLSLEQITFDAMGRERVGAAMATLGAAAPALVRDSVLRRNVRGAFWEAHGPVMVVNATVAEQWGLEESGAERLVPVSIGRSGLASVLAQMEDELLPTQIRSVLLTLVVVLVLLSLVFRSPVAGGLMVVPLAATIAVNFGALGYLSLGLDSFTAMVASIAIGLGVDYSIHFTHRFRRELARAGGRTFQALTNALQTSGVAILVNAVAVGFGFMVLLAATCQHIRRFGGLTSLTMFVAGSFTLLLLPALYLTVRPRFLQARSRAPGRLGEGAGLVSIPGVEQDEAGLRAEAGNEEARC
jgi:predicted RND superfamily exporter protein